jgi:hypothetical protein
VVVVVLGGREGGGSVGGWVGGGPHTAAGMVAVGGGGVGRRRRAWRWAMRAAASAVVWTAVVQLASIAGLFRPRVLADCGGGAGGGGGAATGLAALAGEDSVAARLSPPALVPKSEWPRSSFPRCRRAVRLLRHHFRTGDLGGGGASPIWADEGSNAAVAWSGEAHFRVDSARSRARTGGFFTRIWYPFRISGLSF